MKRVFAAISVIAIAWLTIAYTMGYPPFSPPIDETSRENLFPCSNEGPVEEQKGCWVQLHSTFVQKTCEFWISEQDGKTSAMTVYFCGGIGCALGLVDWEKAGDAQVKSTGSLPIKMTANGFKIVANQGGGGVINWTCQSKQRNPSDLNLSK
ncbi:hypothetical protein RJ527_02355 [Thalassospiraceae bacterium LMO-SO8]|nr:hypothetical protein [Alphaproteobacteria bacterium LMO-S08]WND76595.1 hypothetical protein RJ527_02355 [Thalassospiraceae bacterium LMO-SO8]